MAYSEIRHFSNLVDQLPFVADELIARKDSQKDSNKGLLNSVSNVIPSNLTTANTTIMTNNTNPPGSLNAQTAEILKNLSFPSQKFMNDSSNCEPSTNIGGIEMQNRPSSFSVMNNNTKGVQNESVNENTMVGDYGLASNLAPSVFNHTNNSMMNPSVKKFIEEYSMNTNVQSFLNNLLDEFNNSGTKQRISDYMPEVMKAKYLQFLYKSHAEQNMKDMEPRDSLNKTNETTRNGVNPVGLLSGKGGASNWNFVNPKDAEFKGTTPIEPNMVNTFEPNMNMSYFNNINNENKINDELKLFEIFASQIKGQNNLGNINIDELFKIWKVRNSDSTNASEIFNNATHFIPNRNTVDSGISYYIDKTQAVSNPTNGFPIIDSKMDDVTATALRNPLYSELIKKNILPNQVLTPEKPAVVHLENNKTMVVFPLNLANHGTKYVAVNQKDLLECVFSSFELEGEDNSQTLKAKLYQLKKELEKIKLTYSMQNTHVQQLLNRMVFEDMKETQLKKIIFSLEHEMNKLTEEYTSFVQQSKDGFQIQQLFIELKSKCLFKLYELQPYLGLHFYDILQNIMACRTLGQLSGWIPIFEMKDISLEERSKRLQEILLRGLASPSHTCPKYFVSYQNNVPNKIVPEVPNNEVMQNLIKKSMNEMSFPLNSPEIKITNPQATNHTAKEITAPSNLRIDKHVSSMQSERSSIVEQEEFYFNSMKNPSNNSAVLKKDPNVNPMEPSDPVKRSSTNPEVVTDKKKFSQQMLDPLDEKQILEQIVPFCMKMKEQMKSTENKRKNPVSQVTETTKEPVKKLRTFKGGRNTSNCKERNSKAHE